MTLKELEEEILKYLTSNDATSADRLNLNKSIIEWIEKLVLMNLTTENETDSVSKKEQS